MTLPAQNIHIHMDTLSYFGVPMDVISIIVTAAIDILQVVAIFYGLEQMKRAFQDRNKQREQQDLKLDAQDRKLGAQDRKTDELIEALRIETQALRTLLEGTGPPAPEGAWA